MLKAFSLFACIAVFSAVCPVPQSKGAFEPWASNTDPTDILRRHVQDVTTSPFIYNITEGGTVYLTVQTSIVEVCKTRCCGAGRKSRKNIGTNPLWEITFCI